jgi:hypothetical protein
MYYAVIREDRADFDTRPPILDRIGGAPDLSAFIYLPADLDPRSNDLLEPISERDSGQVGVQV